MYEIFYCSSSFQWLTNVYDDDNFPPNKNVIYNVLREMCGGNLYVQYVSKKNYYCLTFFNFIDVLLSVPSNFLTLKYFMFF